MRKNYACQRFAYGATLRQPCSRKYRTSLYFKILSGSAIEAEEYIQCRINKPNSGMNFLGPPTNYHVYGSADQVTPQRNPESAMLTAPSYDGAS